MLGNFGFWEVMILGLVVLLVFGAKRLPEIGSSLGKGIREFKKSFTETQDAITAPITESPARQIDAAGQPQQTTAEPKRLSQ